MSGRIIILDNSDDSSSDSIPSPSPFSPAFRRRPEPEQDDETRAAPEAKRQRVSVLEQVQSPNSEHKEEEEDDLLSEPPEQENNAKGVEEPSLARPIEKGVLDKSLPEANEKEKGSEESSREADTRSVLERAGKAPVAMPASVSDKLRKQPAKETLLPTTGDSKAAAQKSGNNENTKEEVVSDYITLQEIPTKVTPLAPLTSNELAALKLALKFEPGDTENPWPTTWDASASLFTLEVPNPLFKSAGRNVREQTLFEWAKEDPQNGVFALALLQHLYNDDSTPPTAKRIIAHTYQQSMKDPTHDMEPDIKRLMFDPAVLREDAWTTKRSAEHVGATGGPFHIGQKVFWEKYDGVVIAYIHDPDIGDLWKAMWIDGNETFDLEAEELDRATKAWERKNKQTEQPLPSARFASAAKFTVEGIENGIIMAKSYDPRARHSLFWPARVMHVSEYSQSQSQSRRSSHKQKVQVIFLAPYWNGLDSNPSRLALADVLSQGVSAFSSGPLFEIETIDASEETIHPYTYRGDDGLNVDEFQVAFKFTGLPKNAFPRFLDSHRLALALKMYAQQELQSDSAHSYAGTAALTDTHALANTTAKFPTALLHLPFQYVLSNLPHSFEKTSLTMGRDEDHIEPTIQLHHIMQSMEPPACWGQAAPSPINGSTPMNGQRITPALSAALTSPAAKRQLGMGRSDGTPNNLTVGKIEDVASENLLRVLSQLSTSTTMTGRLLDELKYLLTRLGEEIAELKELGVSQRRPKLLLFLKVCLRIKGQGEDTICSEEFPPSVNAKTLLSEWRKACENIYRHASVLFSCSNFGNAITYIISDSRCNEHITSNGCVERPVRLPAALKGSRLASADTGRNIDFLLSVGDDYMTQAEMKVIGMAHSSSYLKRMRAKCSAIEPGATGAALTENSDFEGGEDTRGSRGSYTAAVAGVAAAIKAVDMIVGGQCVNAFCATRPPGHHAGRELHPMGAVSNGFCILNNAACAALYATSPISEHGPGLKRVCVIDIDVHHGNGTQNILCETYDPRFFYISLHAGGALINGYEAQAEDDEYRVSVGNSKQKKDGIFPGRCGDTSPHKGVMNIPLGAHVNPQDVGTALVSLVRPAVTSFAPDLIIVSAGFDAHKNDPLGMGGLSAEDFGHITETICSMANKCCSGRVLSILEGGYGVPCCRPQKDLFLPTGTTAESDPPSAYESSEDEQSAYVGSQSQSILEVPSQPQLPRPEIPSPVTVQPELLDLGNDIPSDMDDQVPQVMHKTLSRCHAEGFVDCVRKHVGALSNSNDRSKA